jgi:hypothetical protein
MQKHFDGDQPPQAGYDFPLLERLDGREPGKGHQLSPHQL